MHVGPREGSADVQHPAENGTEEEYEEYEDDNDNEEREDDVATGGLTLEQRFSVSNELLNHFVFHKSEGGYHATTSTTTCQGITCYVYNEMMPLVLPLNVLCFCLGTLAGTSDTLSFVGYVAIGLEPIVYGLYVHHRIKLTAYMETGRVHTASLEAEGTEVPVYILENGLPTAILDLPAMWTRQGHDRKIHVVYDGWVDLANYRTIIHWADYPSGYNMPVFQFSGHCDMSDVFSSASANNASIFSSWMMSNAHVTSEGDYGGPYSTHSDSHHKSESAPVSDIPIATAQSTDADHLTGVMQKYSKWRLVLSYLWLLMRLAICRGETGNPHFITTAPIEFPASDGRILSENEILVMQNGLVWIFRTRCIKSILWHNVFRVTISAAATVSITPGIPMILADLEPEVFRHTSVLPMETLAFIQSLCYVSLFRKLESIVAQIPGATFDRPFYPPASMIYDKAIETLNIILPLDSDPGHPTFMTCMASLCDLALVLIF
ncbi:uncharacterized protein F5147DRAFT_647426 [Suillus discolor]|uniref:Uncharacterized protein n=1 Tax=Suillus discolor TaxID=1912936 RepID=A0A9P7FI86_9AGAM|nr:uncharacterized protein F5147DRAFT_647426 [Suillus discolor]KAG2119468.1 hypothetical protein F5147DRAFT_647426 [Suillus discolor]